MKGPERKRKVESLDEDERPAKEARVDPAQEEEIKKDTPDDPWFTPKAEDRDFFVPVEQGTWTTEISLWDVKKTKSLTLKTMVTHYEKIQLADGTIPNKYLFYHIFHVQLVDDLELCEIKDDAETARDVVMLQIYNYLGCTDRIKMELKHLAAASSDISLEDIYYIGTTYKSDKFLDLAVERLREKPELTIPKEWTETLVPRMLSYIRKDCKHTDCKYKDKVRKLTYVMSDMDMDDTEELFALREIICPA